MAATPLFFGESEFIMRYMSRRCLWGSGDTGAGKTSLFVCLSHYLLSRRYFSHVVSNMPLAFAVPADAAPLRHVLVLWDETGVELDARSYAVKSQNDVRKKLLAFPRKIDTAFLMSSCVPPDASFRSMEVRAVCLQLFGLLDIWRWSNDSQSKSGTYDGFFFLLHRDWAYRAAPARLASGVAAGLYDTYCAPGTITPVVRWAERAAANIKCNSEDPNAEDWVAAAADFFGVKYSEASSEFERSRVDGGAGIGVTGSNGNGYHAASTLPDTWPVVGQDAQLLCPGNMDTISAAGGRHY